MTGANDYALSPYGRGLLDAPNNKMGGGTPHPFESVGTFSAALSLKGRGRNL
jgi:hypothetical protein